MGAISAIWFLTIGLVFGAHIAGGVAGALVVIVLVVAERGGVRDVGAALALKAKSASARRACSRSCS